MNFSQVEVDWVHRSHIFGASRWQSFTHNVFPILKLNCLIKHYKVTNSCLFMYWGDFFILKGLWSKYVSETSLMTEYMCVKIFDLNFQYE